MLDSLDRFVSRAQFMPHGMCYLWRPGVLWLNVGADALITLAYFSIPFTLLYFVRRRSDLQFNWIFVCFAVFIVACGATHALEIVVVWWPYYWLTGGVKALTAAASVPTALLLAKLVPEALRLPSPSALERANQELHREVAERERAETAVRLLNEELELRVIQRTQQLAAANQKLLEEIRERERSELGQRRHLSRLELLNGITGAIQERQDVLSILQVVLGRLEQDVLVDFCCACLYDRNARKLAVARLGATSSAFAARLLLREGTELPGEQTTLARALGGELVYEADASRATCEFPRQFARVGLGSLVAAPLRIDGEPFGVLLSARHASDGFSQEDCEFLRQLSEHVALAAQQAQLYADLKKAYEDLRQTQLTALQQERLRALGQMASGIAHDINNALSPAALYSQSLLEHESGLTLRGREYLELVLRAIQSAGLTVDRLREFSRSRSSHFVPAPVDLRRLIPQVVELTRARWLDMPQERGVVVRVETSLAPELPAVLGSDAEIRDALTNLVLNAADAMSQGGVLTLRAYQASSRVRVEVSDTGVGMDEETRGKCLEPFFTTKGERGTGLGLAMVYGTVQRHGAEIDISSEPQKGTTVSLTFPIASDNSPPVEKPPAALEESAPARRPLRILVIDDDPLLLKLMRDTLEADGHRVVAADGGQAGIDAFFAAQKRGDPFAVVLSDLGMPYVDGRKVASAVKAASRKTPVILVTGWGRQMHMENDLPPEVDRVIAKPPRLEELRQVLASVTAASV